MKTIPKNAFGCLLACCAFAPSAALGASSLTALFEPNKPLEIWNQNEAGSPAEISVVDGLAGYSGVGGDPNGNNSGNPAPVSGAFGDGTVVDYRFFDNVVDENVSLELVTYASGTAGRIGTFTATDASNVSGGNIGFINVTTSSGSFSGNTMARVADGTGMIDITDMTTGQIYFLAGGFGGTERFTLTMKGAGQPDIIVQGDGSWPRPNRVHLHDWSFENTDLLYDTIEYTYFHADRDGSAARFGGVILDGEIASASAIPEPSALALAALGALSLIRRRRR